MTARTASVRGRSAALGLLAAAAALAFTASCAAGQHAQTADVKPGIDGTQGRAGKLLLEGVAIHAPQDARSYAAGENAQLAITIVNVGNSADTLVNVSSTAFTGWGVVDNADASTVTETSGADTGLTIEAGSAARLGLADIGADESASPRTLVLMNLAKGSAPLFPGNTVDITFRFANAGTATLHVPVHLTSEPNEASIPAPSGTPLD